MNRILFLAFALCACDDPEASLLPDGQSPPIGNTPEFVVSTITPGSQLRMTWGGLPPGTNVTFGVSTRGTGNGPCPAALQGECLDILAPSIVGTATVGADGRASLVRNAPRGAGGALTFQAGAVVGGTGYVSNTFDRGVGPGMCPFIFDPVCGYDLVSYDNECMAHAAGMPVLQWGFCP